MITLCVILYGLSISPVRPALFRGIRYAHSSTQPPARRAYAPEGDHRENKRSFWDCLACPRWGLQSRRAWLEMGKAQKEKINKLIFSLLSFSHTMLNNHPNFRCHLSCQNDFRDIYTFQRFSRWCPFWWKGLIYSGFPTNGADEIRL